MENSETHVNGCTGLEKSVTILTFLPSGFTTKKAGEHHSVGSWHGVITFFASNSFTQASAGSLNLSSICLAAETR